MPLLTLKACMHPHPPKKSRLQEIETLSTAETVRLLPLTILWFFLFLVFGCCYLAREKQRGRIERFVASNTSPPYSFGVVEDFAVPVCCIDHCFVGCKIYFQGFNPLWLARVVMKEEKRWNPQLLDKHIPIPVPKSVHTSTRTERSFCTFPITSTAWFRVRCDS